MISYKDNSPKGWCGDPKRGAAHGRHQIKTEASFAGQIYLRQVRLDAGGYDTYGVYFGIGTQLWWYHSEVGEIDQVLRARNYAVAQEEIQKEYPKATVVASPADNECFTDFFEAYLEMALSISVDSKETPLDEAYTINNFDSACYEALKIEARQFFDACASMFLGHYARAGELFWYTRNGIGINFHEDFDSPHSVELYEAACVFQEVFLYVEPLKGTDRNGIFAEGYENGPEDMETVQQRNARERDDMLRVLGGFIPSQGPKTK